MNLNDLITLAADQTGSLKELAAEMGKHQNRLSEWKRGAAKPDASEIAFLAERAGVPVLKTVAEIERLGDFGAANSPGFGLDGADTFPGSRRPSTRHTTRTSQTPGLTGQTLTN